MLGGVTLLKVMVVDDNKSDLNGVVDFTPWSDFDAEVVATAQNGIEGYQKAMDTAPDIVITDISMPLMGGVEMVEKIRRELPNVSVIFMSCVEDFQLVKRIVNIGGCQYISKPIDIDDIVSAIAKIKLDNEEDVRKAVAYYRLERQFNENLLIMREDFFRGVLYNGVTVYDDIEDRANGLGIDIDSNYSMIFLAQNTEMSDKKPKEYIFGALMLKNLADECILSRYGGVSIMLPNNFIVLVLSETYKKNDIFERLKEMQAKFMEDFEYNFIACILRTSDKLENLSDRFNTVYNYLCGGSVILNDNFIIMEDEITPETQNVTGSTLKMITNEVFQIMTEKNYESLVQRFCEKYFSDENKANIKFIVLTVIMDIITFISERTEIKDNNLFVNYINDIPNIKTIEQSQNFFRKFIVYSRKLVETAGESREKKIVNIIKQDIEQNYMNIRNIEQIAKKVYVSANYANRIFKKTTNTSIYSYLLNYRMNIAKKLLSETDYNINQISEMIGYDTNPTYFSAAFKSFFGVTPSQFRNNGKVL